MRNRPQSFALMLAVLLLVTAWFPASSSAQTDTTNVNLTQYAGDTYCVYTVAMDLSAVDSTATYETDAFFIGDVDSNGLTTYFSPSADTVGVTVDLSNDLTNWYTFSWAAADSIITGTTLDFNPAGLDGFRYASFDMGWTNGSVGTVTAEVMVRKRTGSRDGCTTLDR